MGFSASFYFKLKSFRNQK